MGSMDASSKWFAFDTRVKAGSAEMAAHTPELCPTRYVTLLDMGALSSRRPSGVRTRLPDHFMAAHLATPTRHARVQKA